MPFRNIPAYMNTSSNKSKKIAFWVPYPIGVAPSQRFRFEQYFHLLLKNNYTYTVFSFLDKETWHVLYKKGFLIQKIIGVLSGFIRRTISLFSLHKYDIVFIHREASPIGPPIFEWIIKHICRKKIIYDYDDAIWIPTTSENNAFIRFLKSTNKISKIITWSYKVSCGNNYLANFSRKYNNNVFVNPTTIDTEGHHNRNILYTKKNISIGWTGTHSTIHYIDFIIPVLQKLEEKYSFDFIVISNLKPSFNLKSLLFIPWNKETEIDDLTKIDIGIMPLKEDAWSEGKCGFKGLQYMSLGIPTIMSPIGVNKDIIENNLNGFLCSSEEEWYKTLESLLIDQSLREKIGTKGKEKILKNYSVKSNTENFLSLFKN